MATAPSSPPPIQPSVLPSVAERTAGDGLTGAPHHQPGLKDDHPSATRR